MVGYLVPIARSAENDKKEAKDVYVCLRGGKKILSTNEYSTVGVARRE